MMVDLKTNKIDIDGVEIPLSPKQAKIASILCWTYPGNVDPLFLRDVVSVSQRALISHIKIIRHRIKHTGVSVVLQHHAGVRLERVT
jgi:hypothetical protein